MRLTFAACLMASLAVLAATQEQTMAQTAAKLTHDLTNPEYLPPDTPAWAREDFPKWLDPYRGKNGLPAMYRDKPGPLSTGTKGIDRYQANQFIVYCPATAEYLYSEYTPLTANYVPGTLPSYERVVAQYTAGLTTETEKAKALLLRALPAVSKHPTMPPIGGPTPADRNLDDEALLASGRAWCNEQARIFVRLCQVAGMQARIIHLFGQNHTTAEFYADGQWAFADVSYFFVAEDENGKLLSVADTHDRGRGQRLYAQAKARRIAEIAAMTDQELNMSAEAAAKYREGARKFDAEKLAKDDNIFFAVINYPLPK